MDLCFNQKKTFLINLFKDIPEGLIIVDQDKNIIHLNIHAQKLLGNIGNIKKIEHLFNFDLCILKEENIINYNPLSAAILNDEDYKTECLYQISQNKFKKFIVKSTKLNDQIAIFISNISDEKENKELNEQLDKSNQEIAELKQEVKEYYRLKERAESQAIRVGLINRISTSIRDSLDIDKIIETALYEISKTLGVYKSVFASYDKENNLFIIKQNYNINVIEELTKLEICPENDIPTNEILKSNASIISTQLDAKDNTLKPRLTTPIIHQGQILGLMAFLYSSQNRQWHQEEIALVEGIAAQVGAAIYRVSLFNELENQKQDLEETLSILKQTQTQLIQSEKMASLGQLVAGVAHEINTPMGALNSNNSILIKCFSKLQSQIENSQETISIFSTINEISLINNEAIRRINNIVKSLKNFARLDEAELKEVNIHEGLISTLFLISHELKNKITIIEDYGELPPIKCYPNALNQVFMNILINAIQSISGNGTISIKTQKINNKAVINITDSGKGIPKENLSKIFDPGYTTKGVGVGTGLGLSICYQIIEKHNGEIKVDSIVNKGTTFTIELPIS